ncbi:hypothetical protein LKL35_08790 [Streptomyces sp. ET3-23]|uniref:hypothetical protein n=1 Tax=Streptomyces sp. ET3-23 TaxID=2885643 RepID=UPI001D12BD2A|nr:hypothetical protein [Streptomyces sp. ET3-23]MCC2275517.1 hypothetical protein [Streptomyces sp. ET3-23]
MTHPLLTLGTIPDLSLATVGIPAAVLALALTAWAIRHRTTRSRDRARSLAVKVAAIAALGCTAYSADTSWRFAADYLDMAGTAERGAMFGAAELALFATALMARENLVTQGAPGLPGTLVWVVTGVQVIPAYAESGLVGGTVRAFVGPVMAAMLWHQAMGIELRLRIPGAASRGLIATLGREARERLLSRLGIAARDRDAAQITRDRATARAVALACRLAVRTPAQRQGWRGRRITRKLSKAIGRASVGTDPTQRDALLDQLAARRHALALATVPLPSPWSPHDGGDGTATVPAPNSGTTAVPIDGPRANADALGDRGPSKERGSVPESAPSPSGQTVPGDRDTGTGAGEAPGQAPDSHKGPEVTESGTDSTGDRGPTDTDTGTDPTGDRGPTDTDTGTDPTGDRGPTDTDTGTDPTGDRGPTDTDTGTDPTGDRGHTVPLRRMPTTKAKSKGKRGGPSRSPRTQRPSRELQESVDQLVQQVRPHVPELLARDGNEAVTRVQLREILRREGLTGGRNDRLSLVLQQLRSGATTTTTRSTTR